MAEASIDVAETKRSDQVEQDGIGHEHPFEEIREETLQTEQQVWTKQTQLSALCDICFTMMLRTVSASYLCYLCKQYMCVGCSKRHDKSHSIIEKESMGDERDGQIERFLDAMRKESESERMEMFNRADVSFVDIVNFHHELDNSGGCYMVSGLCGLDDQRLVICETHNNCIKVFSIGSHILQRYIRFGSEPWGVTAIKLEQEHTAGINVKKVKPLKRSRAAIDSLFSVKRESNEQGVIAASDISEPNQSKPDKQCLIAVTLPSKRKILFINLTQTPAIITQSIKTRKHCWDIAFSGDEIVTVCSDDNRGVRGPCLISVFSTGGVELLTINTPLDLRYDPCLAVCSGRFYLTDWDNNKVLCMNNEGKVVSHNTIGRSRPEGITVDPDTEKVYISGRGDLTLYRLDSRLESFESLFKFNPVYCSPTGPPERLFVHRDRLYISHGPGETTIVSVVRVI